MTDTPRREASDAKQTAQSISCASGKLHVFQVELPKLESTFALDQLTGLSHHKQEIEFVGWLVSLFGPDIPLRAHRALRRDLHERKFKNPPIRVVLKLPGMHPAAYDESTQCILVTRALIERARMHTDDAWELMIALVEEFGHHVHWSLRHRYSHVGGDAPLDEGALFAHAVVLLRYEKYDKTPFATLSKSGTSERLFVDHTKMHEAVGRWLSEKDLRDDEREGSLKFFPAGPGNPGKPGVSFGHESIEYILEQAGFVEYQRMETYFGNWLRDYSQFVDPKAIRPPGSTQEFLSRDDLTQIVGILAEVKFGTAPQYAVTRERLGVYRPEEHIDNPRGLADATWIDKDFSTSWVPADGVIDPTTLMKAYVQKSVRYIENELLAAAMLGETSEGRRRLGQGLHTLEDFFAHSNFIELALIKRGYTQVIPWTAPLPGGTVFPLVTGSFGGTDTAASVILVIAEQQQKMEPFEAGKRTSSQKILLIMLRRQMPKQALLYEYYLDTMEKFAKEHPKIFKASYDTIGWLSRNIAWMLGGLVKVLGNNVDEAQSLFDKDATSSDPTHSQLAKDHADHPLHTLAADLAQQATLEVGRTMKLIWAQRATPQAAVRAATSYICHPIHTTWMDHRVSDWAQRHPAELQRATSKTWMEHFQKTTWQDMKKRADKLAAPVPKVIDRLKELMSK